MYFLNDSFNVHVNGNPNGIPRMPIPTISMLTPISIDNEVPDHLNIDSSVLRL